MTFPVSARERPRRWPSTARPAWRRSGKPPRKRCLPTATHRADAKQKLFRADPARAATAHARLPDAENDFVVTASPEWKPLQHWYRTPVAESGDRKAKWKFRSGPAWLLRRAQE